MNSPERRQRRTVTSSDASYELVSHLASGGMAELFLARRRGNSSAAVSYVVLKRILAAHARNSHFVTMFLDEARLASRLNHPNIATLIDVGRTGDTYFYTMEYVHGENVRDLLRRAQARGRRIPMEIALSIVLGAAAGLHAAHEQRDRSGRPLGIVHRDVSPSNVMAGYDGSVKVVDFGVAKAADRMTETRTGTVKGKIAYLSPEQCRLRPVDRRSDVFSLGIVAWELLTQQRLFRHDNDYDAMHAIVAGDIEPPSRLAGGVPEWLDAIVVRALERDVDRRPETAAQLASALEQGARAAGWRVGPEVLAPFMESLFGPRPLPWLDPSFPEHEPDTDVVSLGSIDASLIVGDTAPSAPAPAARPTAPLRAERPPPATPEPAGPAVEPIGFDVTSNPSLSLATFGTEVPASPPRRRRRISVITGTVVAAGVVAAIVVGATDPDPLVANPPVAALAVTQPAAPPPEPAPPAAPAIVETAIVAPAIVAPATVAPATAPPATSDVAAEPAPSRRARAEVSPTETARAAARTAARRGEWNLAATTCTEGLRERPGDRELTTVCALAACNLGRASVARYHIARLSGSGARNVTAACVARGTFSSSTECDDDPASCR